MKFFNNLCYIFVGILAVERKDPITNQHLGLTASRPAASDVMPTSSTAPASENQATPHLLALRLGAASTLGHTGTESVPESAVDSLQVSHSAGTGGPPALGLLAPVVCFIPISISKPEIFATFTGLSEILGRKGMGIRGFVHLRILADG